MWCSLTSSHLITEVTAVLGLVSTCKSSGPGIGRYIVTHMFILNGGPLSSGPIPGGRLKNLKDIDKLSSMSPCLSVRGMSVIRGLGLYLCSRDGLLVLLVLFLHRNLLNSLQGYPCQPVTPKSHKCL